MDKIQNSSTQKISRRSLIEKLRRQMGDEIDVVTSNGQQTIVVFKSQVAKKLRIKGDDPDYHLKKVAKSIKEEIESIALDRNHYTIDLDRDNTAESSSITVQKMLEYISPKFKDSLQSIMIGNMITSFVRNQPTDLQVALSALLNSSKSIIQTFHDYGVTCSYDEINRFKKSAAVASLRSEGHGGMKAGGEGLVQVVVDNFDADISSQNGKSSTHALAMIITRPGQEDETDEAMQIPRLNRTNRRLPIEDENEIIEYYTKEQKPRMPQRNRSRREQACNSGEAERLDFVFLQQVVSQPDCPEFAGYNVQQMREGGAKRSRKTNVEYLPLIDNPPSAPATMMTAMLKAKEICHALGQSYVVLTADLQLYKVALHLKWENRTLFDEVHLRMGGMHLLMNYVGAIGTLMANSGLEEILGAAFSGVQKMLSGKKFPQNVRALRLLVEELLRPVFEKNPGIKSMENLRHILDQKCEESRTTKLWITLVIYPVLNIMKFVRAERTSDWLLHLASVKEMRPLFFAAGHPNYARYTEAYLQDMESLPLNVQKHFLEGQHTFHHKSGLFNGIWSDMAIESTYMRYGHGHSGIIGLTLSKEAVKTWAYSRHVYSRSKHALDAMNNQDLQPSSKHKEEGATRIKKDAEDRAALSSQLDMSLHPLKEALQPAEHLINIASGEVVRDASVNVSEAVFIGTLEMNKFSNQCPEDFHQPIKKMVIGMNVAKKHIKINDNVVIDPEVIYARAMAIQNSPNPINQKRLLSFELAPVPTAMFTMNGMRTTEKAVIKNRLQVNTSLRTNYSALFIDGCAMLWAVPWPSGKTVSDFIGNFVKRLQDLFNHSNVIYLIFDW